MYKSIAKDMKWKMIILKQIGSVVIVYNNSVIKYVSWANCKMKQIHKKKWNWYFYSRFIQLCFTKNNFSHSPWAPAKQKEWFDNFIKFIHCADVVQEDTWFAVLEYCFYGKFSTWFEKCLVLRMKTSITKMTENITCI